MRYRVIRLVRCRRVSWQREGYTANVGIESGLDLWYHSGIIKTQQPHGSRPSCQLSRGYRCQRRMTDPWSRPDPQRRSALLCAESG